MQSIAKQLGDLFNPAFSESSYGYMPKRSVLQAARQAQEYYRQGYIHQIDIDLEKFSATAPALLYLLHPCSRSIP